MPIRRKTRRARSAERGTARALLSSTARASLPLVVANALSLALLGTGAILAARALGPSHRGQLALYVAIGTWLPLLGTLGIGTAARIQLVSEPVEGSQRLTLEQFTGATLVLVIVQLVVCPVAGWALLPLVHVHPGATGLIVLTVMSGGRLGSLLLMQGLLAYGLTIRDSIVDIAGSAVQLVGIASLFASGDHKPVDYLGAIAISMLVQLCAAYVALSQARSDALPRPTVRSFSDLVHKGYPAVALSLGQSVAFSGDQYIVGLYLLPTAVGVYSVAEGAAELLRVVPFAVGQVIFYRAATGSLTRDTSRIVRRATVAVYIVVGAIAALVARPLFTAVFGGAYVHGAHPFVVLVLAELGISLFFLSVSDSLPRGGLVRCSVVCAGGMVATLVLDFVLIPRFGINGAAWASVIGYWGMGITAIVALRPKKVSKPNAG